MAKRRKFTPKFKAEVVIAALSGESSEAELCRQHNITTDPNLKHPKPTSQLG